jgi:hypothetical protein
MRRTRRVIPEERLRRRRGTRELHGDSDARGAREEGPQLPSAAAEPGERCIRSRRYRTAGWGGASDAAAVALIVDTGPLYAPLGHSDADP